MATETSSERRVARRTRRPKPLEVRLRFRDSAGAEQTAPAYVVDSSAEGIGLQLRVALVPQSIVSIALSPKASEATDIRWRPTARVRWCRPLVGGMFRAGLMFEAASAPTSQSEAAQEDYYELLQISPSASPEVIHRVYRILAQQWHPDNQDTGDAAAFLALNAAYQVLGDPARRAAYDAAHSTARRHRWQIFHSAESTQGVEAERRKRLGVLRALYTKRLAECSSPEMRAPELEQLLGVSRDHLEFPLWYLKERGYVTRSDNNRYTITAAGVEYAETLMEQSVQPGLAALAERLLPAPEKSRRQG